LCLNTIMPDLKQSLLGHDLGHLRIIAEGWGLELDAPDAQSGREALVDMLRDQDLLVEVLEALPEDALLGFKTLLQKTGRAPWSQFTRRFGVVREMGPGKRDRERPDRMPVSAVEVLWYRGLIGRAFFEAARGTEEFVYIPEDFLTLLSKTSVGKKEQYGKTSAMVLGRAAIPAECASQFPVTDHILDHACTLLVGLRIGFEEILLGAYPQIFIQELLASLGILEPAGVPNPVATREFLEAPRGEALSQLAQTWIHSPSHNDLHHVPNLKPEGEWTNNPLDTRRFILHLLSALPSGTWWSLSAFIADIHQHHPDFQRPSGDYDSWFIRDTRTGEFIRGFEHWQDVEGELIRYLITGPLHWLGITDLASPEGEDKITAFRYSSWAPVLIEGEIPGDLVEGEELVHLLSDGRLNVPRGVPRTVRYQIARFCLWEGENPHEYRYRLSSGSLGKAQESGLKISHLLSILHHNSETIPPNILTALERWDHHGTQAKIQPATILRVRSPQILDALRKSRAARYLGDSLGPAAIILKPGTEPKVLAVLTEMGYLGELVNHQ
jgi:hypothetical protein